MRHEQGVHDKIGSCKCNICPCNQNTDQIGSRVRRKGKVNLGFNEKLDKSNVKVLTSLRSSMYNTFNNSSGGLAF